MGLFSRSSGGGGDKALSAEESFAAILVATISSDGELTNEEIQSLNGVVGRMRLFREMSVAGLQQLFQQIFELHDRIGGSALVEKAASSLPEDMKAPAFVNAVDLVLADGSVGEDEEAVIEHLAGLLRISNDDAMNIIEVLKIKNFN